MTPYSKLNEVKKCIEVPIPLKLKFPQYPLYNYCSINLAAACHMEDCMDYLYCQ